MTAASRNETSCRQTRRNFAQMIIERLDNIESMIVNKRGNDYFVSVPDEPPGLELEGNTFDAISMLANQVDSLSLRMQALEKLLLVAPMPYFDKVGEAIADLLKIKTDPEMEPSPNHVSDNIIASDNANTCHAFEKVIEEASCGVSKCIRFDISDPCCNASVQTENCLSVATSVKESASEEKIDAESQVEATLCCSHVGCQTWEPLSPSKVDFACSAIAQEINRETQLTRPSASFRAEMEKQAEAHQTRYPGGTLPYELRSFSYFMERKMRILNAEESQILRCCFCGNIDKG